MLSLYLCFSQFGMHPKKIFLETLIFYTLYCTMFNAQHHQWQQFYYWCCQPLQSAIMKSFRHAPDNTKVCTCTSACYALHLHCEVVLSIVYSYKVFPSMKALCYEEPSLMKTIFSNVNEYYEGYTRSNQLILMSLNLN